MPPANPAELEGMTPYCIVLTTVSGEVQAQALARQIVEARLGACVQIDRVQSVYRWEGQLCSEPECRLTIKTRKACFTALAQFIRAHHAYEVPEIVQIPVAAGSADYLRWIDEGTQSGDDPPR
ncbi:divalent-cation tolerance protein CutA [Rhodoferax sediminis]|uniref:Divalent-cation tolerance protein CutA n=1 Tax=Rhodoferax sediminis TaxID=2509614 RepID=A0A515DDA2_9BURK|nr:divalent-cation tolerance protein CutA [Rhodoferax sediminis]QDL38408.1 divalent-cation tolerance protein CutA [Rhodoferax sediminis]